MRQFGPPSPTAFGVGRPVPRHPLMAFRQSSVTCCVSLVTLCIAFSVLGAASAETTPKGYGQVTDQLAESMKACHSLAEQMGGYEAVFRRDPMRPLVDSRGELVTSTGLQGGLAVQGIIWSADRPLVVIDDELFGKGDTIGTYTIVKIRSDGVIAQRGTEVVFVPLDRGIVPPEESVVESSTSNMPTGSSPNTPEASPVDAVPAAEPVTSP